MSDNNKTDLWGKLTEHLDNMSEEEKKETVEYFRDKRPTGWLKIDDHLPYMSAIDMFSGGTTFNVRYEDGSESTSTVMDHNIWYYEAKEAGITHWLNK